MEYKNLKQTGMSLASLLIGLAVGSFLITSIMQVFSTSKQVAGLSSNIGQLNQENRFLIYQLDRLISQTGYRRVQNYRSLSSEFSNNHIDYDDEQYIFKAVAGSPKSIIDCDGGTVADGTVLTIRLKIEDNSLLCSTDNESWSRIVDGNLDGFNIYAQVTNPRFEEFRLVDIKNLEDSDKLYVNAVRVSALIRSQGDVRITNDNATYQNLAGDADWGSFGDKKLRNVVEFTVLTPHIYEDLNTHIYDIADASNPVDNSLFTFNTLGREEPNRPWLEDEESCAQMNATKYDSRYHPSTDWGRCAALRSAGCACTFREHCSHSDCISSGRSL